MGEYREKILEPRVRTELASSPAAAVRIIVVEDGSDGLEEDAASRDGEPTLIIAQTGGERPLEFAKRAIRRVWALEQDQRISHVNLLLAPRFDAEATAGRVCLVRALMAHSAAMVAESTSELLFSAGAELHADLQAKVVASAEALRQEPNGTSLPITVQFGTSRPPPLLRRPRMDSGSTPRTSSA